MLRKGNESYFGYICNPSEVEISSANDLVMEMSKEYRKYQKLLKLAEEDRVAIVKGSVDYLRITYAINNAVKWLDMIANGKVDKRKKYEEKDSYEYLNRYLSEEIVGRKVTINSIIREGLTPYAYDFRFTLDSKNYELVVPLLDKLSCENFNTYLHEGKLALYVQTDEINWNQLLTSYKEEDFVEYFKKN